MSNTTTVSLLTDLAMEGDFRVQENRWDGFDVYRSGSRFVRSTIEDGTVHLYGFDGSNMEWRIDLDDVPVRLVESTVRAAYAGLE